MIELEVPGVEIVGPAYPLGPVKGRIEAIDQLHKSDQLYSDIYYIDMLFAQAQAATDRNTRLNRGNNRLDFISPLIEISKEGVLDPTMPTDTPPEISDHFWDEIAQGFNPVVGKDGLNYKRAREQAWSQIDKFKLPKGVREALGLTQVIFNVQTCLAQIVEDLGSANEGQDRFRYTQARREYRDTVPLARRQLRAVGYIKSLVYGDQTVKGHAPGFAEIAKQLPHLRGRRHTLLHRLFPEDDEAELTKAVMSTYFTLKLSKLQPRAVNGIRAPVLQAMADMNPEAMREALAQIHASHPEVISEAGKNKLGLDEPS